jgi:hypothetical protein
MCTRTSLAASANAIPHCEDSRGSHPEGTRRGACSVRGRVGKRTPSRNERGPARPVFLHRPRNQESRIAISSPAPAWLLSKSLPEDLKIDSTFQYRIYYRFFSTKSRRVILRFGEERRFFDAAPVSPIRRDSLRQRVPRLRRSRAAGPGVGARTASAKPWPTVQESQAPMNNPGQRNGSTRKQKGTGKMPVPRCESGSGRFTGGYSPRDTWV